MTDENVEERCKCGRPATEPARVAYELPRCMICHLVACYGAPPPRTAPGNIGDWEFEAWMGRQLRKAIEEMVSLMRSDLDALAERWTPPVDDSTQDGNQP
ncbi:MAG: hypothetical protein IID32_10605 [Planctomycetes bacterium]|nr:hypothetical protein [Planctomycetota bacterium]